MRSTLTGSVLLSAALLLGACGNGVEQVGGAAGPVTPSPAASSATATEPATPSTPPSVSASPATPKAPSTPSTPAGIVLGPQGFGALKLGMTAEEATATGMIKSWKSMGVADGCTKQSTLKLASGDHGFVYFSTALGLEIIDAYPGVSTPEGVKIGTTHAAMLKAYPGWANAEEEDQHAEGRGYVRVPGNGQANYRILTRDGKVAEITLQSTTQDCYE
ncbi:hypothetical protein BJ973_005633 [Actinoplanes tereljensis]|uniref:Lipoprotein n=1 Tax=Paractinoplanes tereljensis TaxID=571912 RepID=A0A919NXQ0_9ACTN|nr:hypothetical protein [Actinoplanes tereljensis]GIF26278.1 hypothetical protein Ate02nite_90080 [Actinoplanes tereljensis]